MPGDIALLEAGDLVPADGRIVSSASLELQEAALTGEADLSALVERLGNVFTDKESHRTLEEAAFLFGGDEEAGAGDCF